MVSLKTKPHLSLRKYLAQYKPQSLQRTLKINDKGNKLVKLSTKQTDRNKLIFHFFLNGSASTVERIGNILVKMRMKEILVGQKELCSAGVF